MAGRTSASRARIAGWRRAASPAPRCALLRKVTKAGVRFPDDDAVIKLLWLPIINIEDERPRTPGPSPADRQTP
jgi:hypothetical protein